MTWAKLDDTFPEHPKVVELSDRAFRAHVTALCYCARNLTDGHLPAGAVRTITLGRKASTSELLDAGVWDQNGDGGYLIHDYLDYNPSREHVEEQRAKRSSAGRAGAQRKWRKERINQQMRGQIASALGATPGEISTVTCNYCATPIIVDWTKAERVRFLDNTGRPTPEIDHVIPLAVGGKHAVENMALSCLKCNRTKGTTV